MTGIKILLLLVAPKPTDHQSESVDFSPRYTCFNNSCYRRRHSHAEGSEDQDANRHSPSLNGADLKMRSCLAWVDSLLKCLAAPAVSVRPTDATAAAELRTATDVHAGVLIHLVTSFWPGSHSRVGLKLGTAAKEACVKLGNTGAHCSVDMPGCERPS
jgi:hypothetical protein